MKENFSLTNDFIFRNIFGDEKNADLLLSLVNAVFESKRLPPLVSIFPVSPFLPVHQLTQREGILDVHAVDSAGRQYDLEIQVRSQENYVKRSLYYLARMYGGQLARGSDFKLLVPCIGINFLDFRLFPEDALFHHYFTYREFDHPEQELSREMSIHFLELPKFMEWVASREKHPVDPLKAIEKWLYLIKEIEKPEDSMCRKYYTVHPNWRRFKRSMKIS